MAKDSILQGHGAPTTEAATGPARTASTPAHPAEVQLELERLRAERDAMAAELQIERAERLRTEERLRLLEREKLEQMRQGAASREKLASELEEARLRAMRSEAKQAALEADTRLAEIESRRRGHWEPPSDDADRGAGEIAERADDRGDDDGPSDEPSVEAARTSRGGPAIPQMPPARAARPPRGRLTTDTPEEEAPGSRAERDRAEPRGSSAASANSPPRRSPPRPETELPTSRLRGPATAPRSASEERAYAAQTHARSGGAGSGPPPRGSAGAAETKGGTAGKGAGAAGARGGAAAGRPSIDRPQLEARLAAGAAIKTTERFLQFQPVSQSHIKVCDWLGQAKTLAEIQALATGKLPEAEILNVLVLFFERSFLVLE